jgi:uncharacterized protein (TIGR02996 family)
VDEREALQRAVAAAPDDDLPRLVFADWVEEHGETDYAAFVRAQVELATTPPWEPFAVHCKHYAAEYVTGAPWWDALPAVDGYGLEWHPEYAFRRGFGRSLIVRDMATLFAAAPRLFELAPVDQLHLPTATLDDWRRFVAQPWLSRVTSLHFYGTRTPIEPVRELCASPPALLSELVFEASSRPGMPVLIEGLMRSPLGRQLRSLELRAGPEDPTDLLYAIGSSDSAPRLERLALVTIGGRSDWSERLFLSPALQELTSVELVNTPGVDFPFVYLTRPAITRLRASGCQISSWRLRGLIISAWAKGLQSLDLSRNPMDEQSLLRFDARFRKLRSLNLRQTGLSDGRLQTGLTEARFWPKLVELDLRDNQLTDASVRHFLAAPVPPDLVALLLTGNPISDDMRARLREYFGARVIV